MPLQFQEIEIPLGGGPDEKTGRLLRTPGVIRAAINADHRQAGIIRKRRGYTRVDLDAVVNTTDDSEEKFHAVATYRGELVIIGSDHLYAIVSLDGNLTGDNASATIIRRGAIPRGGFAIQHVVSSSLGSEV